MADGNALFDSLFGGSAGGTQGTGGAQMPTSVSPAAGTMNYGQPRIGTAAQTTKSGKKRLRPSAKKVRKRKRGKGKTRARQVHGGSTSRPTTANIATGYSQNPRPYIGNIGNIGSFL